MKLLSAYDDFCQRTLGALAHLWEKLEFVASLRSEEGRYHHWGMASAHGNTEAAEAMARAHTQLFLKVLGTPIQDLWSDAAGSKCSDGGWFLAGVDKMRSDVRLVPEDRGGGAKEHLQLILRTLAQLARARGQATGRAA